MPAKRISDEQRRDQQLLLRLTRAEMEMLESAAHLERKTANSYVHDLVAAHVEVLATNHFVAADVANRRAYSATRSTTTELRTFHRNTGGTEEGGASSA